MAVIMPIRFALNVFARQWAFVFTSGVCTSPPDTRPRRHLSHPTPPSCKRIYPEGEKPGVTSSYYCSFCGLICFIVGALSDEWRRPTAARLFGICGRCFLLLYKVYKALSHQPEPRVWCFSRHLFAFRVWM